MTDRDFATLSMLILLLWVMGPRFPVYLAAHIALLLYTTGIALLVLLVGEAVGVRP